MAIYTKLLSLKMYFLSEESTLLGYKQSFSAFKQPWKVTKHKLRLGS